MVDKKQLRILQQSLTSHSLPRSFILRGGAAVCAEENTHNIIIARASKSHLRTGKEQGQLHALIQLMASP